MSFLLPGQIACIRSTATNFLADSVTLRNPGVPTRGTAAGVIASAPVDTAATGRLQQSGFSGDIRAVVERLELVNAAVWYFAYTQTNLTEKTQIIFGTRVFNVRAVDKEGAMGVELTAICDEVR